jgi:hypothetical protein
MSEIIKLKTRRENVIRLASYNIAMAIMPPTHPDKDYDAQTVADWAVILYRTLTHPHHSLYADKELYKLSERLPTRGMHG